MKPAQGLRDASDLLNGNRPAYDKEETPSVFDATERGTERAPDAFGAVSESEVKRAAHHLETTAQDETDEQDEQKTIPLPPYVIASGAGALTTYVFTVPAAIRPKLWPASVSLGSAKDARHIAHAAWEMYAHLLHDLHAEKAALVQKHPATLMDAIAHYKNSEDFKGLSLEERAAREREMKRIERWSEENNHPALSTLSPEHVNGYLLAHEGPHTERNDFLKLLHDIIDQQMHMGHLEFNAAAEATLPAESWEAKSISTIDMKPAIFANKLLALALVPE